MARALLEDIPEARLTTATLQRMYRLVDAGKTDPAFQEIVRKVVNHALPGQWKNYRAEAQAILSWVKRTINYRRDPVNVELLQDVWRTLDTQAGDCDDFSVLLGAALESIGNPIRFVTVSTREDHTPSHVYIESFIDGRWTPIDGIVRSSTVGWQPTTGITNRQVWTRSDVGLSGYEERPVEGLGMIDWTDDGILARENRGDDTISHTRANPMPGDVIVSRRRTPSDDVSQYADPDKTLLPGAQNGYSVPRVIESHIRPEQLHKDRIPAEDVPMVFNNQDLVGRVPTWESNPNAIYPEPRTAADHDLVDLSGLGMGGLGAGIRRVMKRRMMKKCKCGTTLEGLGVISADDAGIINQDAPKLASAIANSANAGEISKSPSVLSSAIDLAINLWTTKKTIDAAIKPKVTTPTVVKPVVTASAAGGMPSWAVPAGIAAVGALFLFKMMR